MDSLVFMFLSTNAQPMQTVVSLPIPESVKEVSDTNLRVELAYQLKVYCMHCIGESAKYRGLVPVSAVVLLLSTGTFSPGS